VVHASDNNIIGEEGDALYMVEMGMGNENVPDLPLRLVVEDIRNASRIEQYDIIQKKSRGIMPREFRA